MNCLSKSQYYIQLEDDVIAKSGFVGFIMENINAQVDDWFLLEFSKLGFIGKLFKSKSLNVSECIARLVNYFARYLFFV